ncbi:MAG: mechanosensitive ion channel family protein, partial [Pseudomonas sp.]
MGTWVKRYLCVLFLLWTVFHYPVNAAQDTVESVARPAELEVVNRSIFTFRVSLLGEVPAVRAQRAQAVINEILNGTEDPVVRLDAIQDSYLVLLGGRRAFIVTPKDIDPDTSVADAAAQVAQRLGKVVEESQQA